jgi:hypothetical protein
MPMKKDKEPNAKYSIKRISKKTLEDNKAEFLVNHLYDIIDEYEKSHLKARNKALALAKHISLRGKALEDYSTEGSESSECIEIYSDSNVEKRKKK